MDETFTNEVGFEFGLRNGIEIEIGRIQNPADDEDGGEDDGHGHGDPDGDGEGENENEGQGEIRYTNANVYGLGLGSGWFLRNNQKDKRKEGIRNHELGNED
jgi:hypothetical protein